MTTVMVTDETTTEPGIRDPVQTHVAPPMESLEHVFARPRRIGTLNLADGTTSFDKTKSLWALYSAIPVVAAKLTGYLFSRGKPKVSIQFQGSPFVMGTMDVRFFPLMMRGDYDVNAPTIPAWFTAFDGYLMQGQHLPGFRMNYEAPCTCELLLPWPQPASFGKITLDDWFFGAAVLNGPRMVDPGVTFPGMLADVYLSYEEVELYASVTAEGKAKVKKREDGTDETGGLLSRGLAYGASLLAAGGPEMTPYALAAELGSIVAAQLGFSRPLVPAMTAMVPHPYGQLSFVSGQPDFSQKLALDPATLKGVDGTHLPLYAGGDSNIKQIARRWCLVVKDVVVSSSGVIAVDFNNGPVSQVAHGAVTKPTIGMTNLNYLGAFFRYVRGTIEVEVEFVATPLVRARYAIVTLPVGVAAPASYGPGINLPTTVVEVAGRTKVIVTIPWTYETPFVQTALLQQSRNFGLLVTSAIRVYELASPVGSSGAHPVVVMNVSTRGCEDIEYAMPELTWINGFNTVHFGVWPEGKVSVATFGESVEDLNLLTRRPCFCTSLVFDVPTNNTLSLPAEMFLPAETTTYGGGTGMGVQVLGIVQWTYYNLARVAFYSTSGGTRIKAMMNVVATGENPFGTLTTPAFVEAGANLLSNYTTAFSTGAMPFSNGVAINKVDHTGLLEVDIPDRNRFVARRGGQCPMTVNAHAQQWSVLIHFPIDPLNDLQMLVAHSASDDFLVAGFLGPPLLHATGT